MQLCYNEVQTLQTDVDKFLEDVTNGIYPLTAFAPNDRVPVQRLPGVSGTGGGAASSASSVSGADVDRSRSPADSTTCSASTSATGQAAVMSQSATEPEPEPEKIIESRKIVRMSAELKPTENGSTAFVLTLLLKLEDMMNRQLTAEISESDDADMLVNELVLYGFVKEDDYAELTKMVRDTLQAALLKSASDASAPSDCSSY
uniref:Uncharacterized protein n=1 Tax=Plectus sambesii TaxID=2011161 RepID=A0A914V1R9_9BILA